MYALVHLLSLNPWAVGQRAFPQIAPRLRWLWYLVFAGVCMSAGLLGTALGWLGVGAMPEAVAMGLVFLKPLYIDRPTLAALLLGAVTGPLVYLVLPDWGLLVTGLVAGTAGFLVGERLRRRRA